MNYDETRSWLWIIAWTAMAIGATVGCAQCAHAQDRPQTDEETLAALCVNEAGFDHPGDCWGIYAVLANQAAARGTTWQRYARAHSRHFFAGTGNNPWTILLRDEDHIRGLTTAMQATWQDPRAEGHVSRREAFHDLVTLAFEILHSPPSCGAMSWGSHADYETGRFHVWHEHDVFVTCGDDARNLYSHGASE